MSTNDSNYKHKKFKPFNDHTNCKGHSNFMLDSTLESESDRQAVILAVDNALKDYENQHGN